MSGLPHHHLGHDTHRTHRPWQQHTSDNSDRCRACHTIGPTSGTTHLGHIGHDNNTPRTTRTRVGHATPSPRARHTSDTSATVGNITPRTLRSLSVCCNRIWLDVTAHWTHTRLAVTARPVACVNHTNHTGLVPPIHDHGPTTPWVTRARSVGRMCTRRYSAQQYAWSRYMKTSLITFSPHVLQRWRCIFTRREDDLKGGSERGGHGWEGGGVDGGRAIGGGGGGGGGGHGLGHDTATWQKPDTVMTASARIHTL